MGADFTAVFNKSLTDEEIKYLHNILNNNQLFPRINSFHQYLTNEFPENKWRNNWELRISDSYFNFSRIRELSGKAGIIISFEEKTIQLHHYIRWVSFVINDLDINIQEILRRICIEVAKEFSCKEIIYVPDSSFKSSGALDLSNDGWDFETITSWLKKECGNPVSNIEDIYDTTSGRIITTGYFIEYIEEACF